MGICCCSYFLRKGCQRVCCYSCFWSAPCVMIAVGGFIVAFGGVFFSGKVVAVVLAGGFILGVVSF